MGTVKNIREKDDSDSGGKGWTVTIGDAAPVLKDCHLGDSICVNGACLTVTEWDDSSFKVGLAPETLQRTDLGEPVLHVLLFCAHCTQAISLLAPRSI